jgi:hypothetical protein
VALSQGDALAYKQQELRAMDFIRMRDTYPDISGGKKAFDAWAEFERRREPNATVNGRVAKDIDLLENLVQLTLYRDALDPSNSARFRQDLLSAMTTGLVRSFAESFAVWADARKTVVPDSDDKGGKRFAGES